LNYIVYHIFNNLFWS